MLQEAYDGPAGVSVSKLLNLPRTSLQKLFPVAVLGPVVDSETKTCLLGDGELTRQYTGKSFGRNPRSDAGNPNSSDSQCVPITEAIFRSLLWEKKSHWAKSAGSGLVDERPFRLKFCQRTVKHCLHLWGF